MNMSHNIMLQLLLLLSIALSSAKDDPCASNGAVAHSPATGFPGSVVRVTCSAGERVKVGSAGEEATCADSGNVQASISVDESWGVRPILVNDQPKGCVYVTAPPVFNVGKLPNTSDTTGVISVFPYVDQGHAESYRESGSLFFYDKECTFDKSSHHTLICTLKNGTGTCEESEDEVLPIVLGTLIAVALIPLFVLAVMLAVQMFKLDNKFPPKEEAFVSEASGAQFIHPFPTYISRMLFECFNTNYKIFHERQLGSNPPGSEPNDGEPENDPAQPKEETLADEKRQDEVGSGPYTPLEEGSLDNLPPNLEALRQLCEEPRFLTLIQEVMDNGNASFGDRKQLAALLVLANQRSMRVFVTHLVSMMHDEMDRMQHAHPWELASLADRDVPPSFVLLLASAWFTIVSYHHMSGGHPSLGHLYEVYEGILHSTLEGYRCDQSGMSEHAVARYRIPDRLVPVPVRGTRGQRATLLASHTLPNMRHIISHFRDSRRKTKKETNDMEEHDVVLTFDGEFTKFSQLLQDDKTLGFNTRFSDPRGKGMHIGVSATGGGDPNDRRRSEKPRSLLDFEYTEFDFLEDDSQCKQTRARIAGSLQKLAKSIEEDEGEHKNFLCGIIVKTCEAINAPDHVMEYMLQQILFTHYWAGIFHNPARVFDIPQDRVSAQTNMRCIGKLFEYSTSEAKKHLQYLFDLKNPPKVHGAVEQMPVVHGLDEVIPERSFSSRAVIEDIFTRILRFRIEIEDRVEQADLQSEADRPLTEVSTVFSGSRRT